MKPYYERANIRIYHGDSREIAPQLEPVDLVVTSPPYADQRRYGFKKGEFRWDHVVPRALAGVNLKPDGQMLVNLGLVHRDGEVICYWEPMIHTLRSFGYRLFGWYVWDKGFGLPGEWAKHGRLAPAFEFVFHFNRESRATNKVVPCKWHGRAVMHGTGFRDPDNEWRGRTTHEGRDIQPFKVPDTVLRVSREHGAGIDHPAVFPVSFAEEYIKAYTAHGQSVLDTFVGSGSTLVAAYRLGRPAIGIEIEESYCEIAAKRLDAEVLPLEMGA